MALVVLVIMLAAAVPAGAVDSNVKVIINGNQVDMDTLKVEGRLLVPIRAVSETIGAKVTWNGDTEMVVITRGLKNVSLCVPDSGRSPGWAMVNGQSVDLDVPAKLVKGTTYVPLRLLSEGLGAEVEWDGTTQTVSITIEELKDLEGLSATVRDAAYESILLKSYSYNMDFQVKIPPFPQMNIMKLSGKMDKDYNSYATGQMFGWPLECYSVVTEVYIKNQLFNNQWVSFSELTGEKISDILPPGTSIDELRNEALKEVDVYTYVSEFVRALGVPKVVAEESAGGVQCQRIEFTPNADSAEFFQEFKDQLDGIDTIKVVVWVGKNDNLIHKIDFRVDFKIANYRTDKEEPGFLQAVIEYSDINKDFKVPKPADLK